MEKKKETIIMGFIGYRIWGIWGSDFDIPKATFYLVKEDYRQLATFERKPNPLSATLHTPNQDHNCSN